MLRPNDDSRMAIVFLGLDVGTSGVKAILVSPSGDVVASASTPLAMSTPHPGWAEQDPEAWWAASLASVRDVLAQRPNDSVAAVGISGQMHSSVFLDRSGSVVRPALLWCDGRTTAECVEITRRAGGEDKLRDWVSNAALEGFTLPKVLWLRRHLPHHLRRAAHVGKQRARHVDGGEQLLAPALARGVVHQRARRVGWLGA